MQIENFSGICKLCIEKDFFANLFVYNLHSIIEKESEQIVAQVYCNRKYTYQINKNISWAFLKDRLIDLFIEEKSRQILLELQTIFWQQLERSEIIDHILEHEKLYIKMENIEH